MTLLLEGAGRQNNGAGVISYSAAVLADSPDAYYPLSESGAGPFVDLVAANNATPNGTIVTHASLLTSDPATSAKFNWNGSLFFATTAHDPSAVTMTVEFWINFADFNGKPGSSPGWQSYIAGSGSSSGWCIFLDSSPLWIYGHPGVANFISTHTPALNTTYHVVCVDKGGTSGGVDFYINGAFHDNQAGGPQNLAGANLLIGNQTGNTAYLQTNGLAHLAVYKSALSAGRIAAHYAAGTT